MRIVIQCCYKIYSCTIHLPNLFWRHFTQITWKAVSQAEPSCFNFEPMCTTSYLYIYFACGRKIFSYMKCRPNFYSNIFVLQHAKNLGKTVDIVQDLTMGTMPRVILPLDQLGAIRKFTNFKWSMKNLRVWFLSPLRPLTCYWHLCGWPPQQEWWCSPGKILKKFDSRRLYIATTFYFAVTLYPRITHSSAKNMCNIATKWFKVVQTNHSLFVANSSWTWWHFPVFPVIEEDDPEAISIYFDLSFTSVDSGKLQFWKN